VRTGYALISWARRLWPDRFSWRPPPYEYELERPAIDILAGNGRVRELIDQDAPLPEIESSWQVDLGHFKKVRERYLMYE
jgi:uncharacterized protein YbbC (DUF1343 family)